MNDKKDNDPQKRQIRNSTAEFLIFTSQAGDDSIEVRVEGETVWLTQQMMATLFQSSKQNISQHINSIYQEKELEQKATVKKFLTVRTEGNREVKRDLEFYSLDMIISVGYRVNSAKATQFRQWATVVLRDFAIKGFVLDKERLKNGTILNQDYFDQLIEEIREIRSSERRFYQKITDIYATALDYNLNIDTTQSFFATVQNKLHFAIHGKTAAEVVKERADSKEHQMGLTTWKEAPQGKIIKSDVSIAKNYLKEKELKSLDRFVTMYLDYAETQAERKIPMTMEDWAKKLNAFLQFNEKDLLNDSGKVSHAVAKAFAESEFEKYRIIQDRLFESDFDRVVKEIQEKSNPNNMEENSDEQ